MGVVRQSPLHEYYSVEIIRCERAPIPQEIHHNRYGGDRLQGKVLLSIETLKDLFIGSGEYETDAEGIYQTFARIDGRPAIPGTAIKGMVRTYAEALSPSCEGGQCRAEQNLCICCSIFGGPGFQGRISLCDAELLEGHRALLKKYPMRARWGGRYDGGRRFYYHNKPSAYRAVDEQTGQINPRNEERVETIGRKARFACLLFFENLSRQEMGLLLLAMGCSAEHPFYPKLGGGKNRLLGSIRIEPREGVQLFSAGAYTVFSPSYEVEDLVDWGQSAVKSYLDSLQENQRGVVLSNVQAFNAIAASTIESS